MGKDKTKLSMRPVQLHGKIDRIHEAIERTRSITPPGNTRLLNKLDRWTEDIDYIRKSLKKVRSELQPRIEKDLRLRIKNDDLLQVAMFQPSTKNLFLEIETEYRNAAESPLNREEFENLANSSEMAKVLALLGDAAISMGVLQHLWSPNVSDVGILTQRRAEIVSNEHMAKVCDEWQLYDHRIHFDPGMPSREEMEHDKGTLLEAVFGIVQIEQGFKGVQKRIHHLL